MSVTLMARAFEYAVEHELAPTRRLVLYVMADGADDDGRLWPGQKRLRRLTGLSVSTIREAIREFEAAGILTTEARVREEGRGRTSNLYLLNFHAPADGDRSSEQPPPPGDRSQDQPPTVGGPPRREASDQPPGDGGPIDRGTTREPSSRSTQSERKSRPQVDRKPVTDAEYSLASEIIAAFNAVAGTRVTVDAHLSPIVGRIREKPELTAEQHRQIIAAVFLVPWWTGPPSPSVIYGNAAQFERCIETWRATPKERLRPAAPPIDLAAYRAGRDQLAAVWPAALESLRAAVGATAGIYLAPLQPVGVRDGEAVFEAPAGVVGWVERRYLGLIAKALQQAGLPELKVRVVTAADDDANAA